MADSIVFTPDSSYWNPSPSAVTFTPVNTMFVVVGTLQQRLEEVTVDRTDTAYIRGRGRTFQTIIVTGTDTFSSQATAQTQLTKMERMLGSSCTITSATYGTYTGAICVDDGQPVIQACASPGFAINYRFTFRVPSR